MDSLRTVDVDARMSISEPTLIDAGSSLDLKSFLSNHTRCLVRNTSNKDDKYIADFDIFEGKIVMICCFSLPVQSTLDSAVARAVSLVSSEMHTLGAFELVVIVNISCGRHDENNMTSFKDFMSIFPSFCFAAPYQECNGICDSLNFAPGSEPIGLLLNRSQIVEWRKPLNFFLEYGVDAFPFTSEMLSYITKWEEEEFKQQKDCVSLDYLLCLSPLPFPKPTSFLRKNPGGQPGTVRMYDIERKCIGLYLCYTGKLIPTLHEIHEKCSVLGLKFEVVLVYMPFNDGLDPESFQDRINYTLEERKISWWVSPFVYWVSCRLWRLCHKDVDDKLIIIDPRSNSTELHGEAAIRHFGTKLISSPRALH